MSEQPASDYSATRSGAINTVLAVGLVVYEPEEAYRPPAKPRLLDQVRAAIRTRHYSHRTEEAYVGWIRRFILFHRKRAPSRRDGQGGSILVPLVAGNRRAVSASTQNQALSALLFLYREVLGQQLGWLSLATLMCARR